MFRASNALLEGHFQLTSGLHSPHYFQCAKVLQYPANAGRLCNEIVQKFRDNPPQVVVAPALGGIVVGQEVARQCNARSIFTERKEGARELRRGFEIHAGERVLVCEDVVTTGGSVQEVVDIVARSGGELVGVAAIVDRSGGKAQFKNFHAAFSMDVVTYKPESCPLCSKGIPVEKPGSRPQPKP